MIHISCTSSAYSYKQGPSSIDGPQKKTWLYPTIMIMDYPKIFQPNSIA
jgi:hypothetical protein